MRIFRFRESVKLTLIMYIRCKDVVVFELSVPRSWLTRSKAGLWYTNRDTDVGSPSEQPDDGDRLKAAVSDALKRAAVKIGVGRYLYRLPSHWVDYDPQAKRHRGEALAVWGKAVKRLSGKSSPDGNRCCGHGCYRSAPNR